MGVLGNGDDQLLDVQPGVSEEQTCCRIPVLLRIEGGSTGVIRWSGLQRLDHCGSTVGAANCRNLENVAQRCELFLLDFRKPTRQRLLLLLKREVLVRLRDHRLALCNCPWVDNRDTLRMCRLPREDESDGGTEPIH